MIGAAVEHMPLVGAEVQRLAHAFQQVSLELASGLTALRDSDFTAIGTPPCDSSVGAGMHDLHSALSALQQSSTDCISVMGRHGELAEPAPTDADQSGQGQPSSGEVES
ncbi:MAG: hypothetical protein WKF72_01680 [Nocardioidaceae bacterium]|jgi:hypothetical protein